MSIHATLLAMLVESSWIKFFCLSLKGKGPVLQIVSLKISQPKLVAQGPHLFFLQPLQLMYSLIVLDNETTFTNPIQSPNIEDLHRAFLVGMRQMRHGLLLCWAGLSLQGCHDPHDVRMPVGHAVQRWQNKNLVSFLETHQEDRTKFIFRSVFWRKNQGLLYHTTAWHHIAVHVLARRLSFGGRATPKKRFARMV